MDKLKSNVIDGNHPDANMHGVSPCPSCKYRCRVPHRSVVTETRYIVCRHCGEFEAVNEEETKE